MCSDAYKCFIYLNDFESQFLELMETVFLPEEWSALSFNLEWLQNNDRDLMLCSMEFGFECKRRK